ncbi:30S ribosomal protein THX [Spirosoma knui]
MTVGHTDTVAVSKDTGTADLLSYQTNRLIFGYYRRTPKLNQSPVMGKGDKKSRRGKISRGSYGRTRPSKVSTDAPKPAESKSAE